MMDHAELKALYKKTFNAVSDGYGHSAMGFFSKSARQIPLLLDLKGDEHVLDVATGTGYVALAVAKQLPGGRVTGIDISEGMLAQAMKNKKEQGLSNVTFLEMDMADIDYKDNYFDVAISAFGIFFIDDMKKQLLHMAKKVKSGGTILITTFFDDSFTPLVNLFFRRLENYGIAVPSLAWKRVATKEQCRSLFKQGGFQKIKVEQQECGYFLRNANDWWYIIWNGGFRGLVNQLSQDDFSKFKEEHFAEVNALKSENGIWLEMSILYTSGKNNHCQGEKV